MHSASSSMHTSRNQRDFLRMSPMLRFHSHTVISLMSLMSWTSQAEGLRVRPCQEAQCPIFSHLLKKTPLLVSQICKSYFAEGGLFFFCPSFTEMSANPKSAGSLIPLTRESGGDHPPVSPQSTRDLHYRDTFHTFMFMVFR